MKNISLIVSLFLIISCSSDNTNVPEQQEMEEVIIPDDQEEDSDEEDTVDFSIPDVVVVGESFDDNLSLFMIQWNQDYSNNTVTDIEAQINIVNPSVLSSSGESFFIKEFGTQEAQMFKYDLNNASPEIYSYNTYFPDHTDDTQVSIRDARKTYLSGYFFDANNSGFNRFIYTYNITTGASKTVLLENFSADLNKAFDSCILTLGHDFLNSQETLLHVFNPETEQEILLPFNEYSAVIYNNITNELFLFEGTGFVSDYDIFSLNSFEIVGSDNLQTPILPFNTLTKALFYQDKMFYEAIVSSQSGVAKTPAMYNFTLGEKLVFDPFLIRSAISDSGVLINSIINLDLDLETETLVVGFEQSVNNSANGGVAFLSYDYEVKRIINTGNIKAENVILKD